jgi:hypothetical protein
MFGSNDAWIEILEVGAMRLWEDEPPATTMTLVATAAEFEAFVESMVAALPFDARTDLSKYGGLAAEVISMENGANHHLTVYRMIVTPGTAPAILHTGNGVGEWVRPGDSIRILGFADGR